MNKKIFLPALLIFLIPGIALNFQGLKSANTASSAVPKTLVLYDAVSGAIPNEPLMGFLAFPQEAALLTYSDGVTVIDTTSAGNDTYAGWVASGGASPGFPILDRAAGFQVNFTLQVENESHVTNHRAGFNVIVLSADAKGIELAFWEDQIWAQSDEGTGGLFTHGESAPFATTSGLSEYQVTIVGETYTLAANSEPILTGPVRDYRAFNGFPDPYETPNFLFLGDNTKSAQGRGRLSFVSITGTEPVMPTVPSVSTSTNAPLPTASFAPLPGATPMPSPTPTRIAVELCPSGWSVLPVLVLFTVGRRKTKTE